MALKSFGTRSFAAITFVALFGATAPVNVRQDGLAAEIWLTQKVQETDITVKTQEHFL